MNLISNETGTDPFTPLVGQIAFKQSGTTRMTTTKSYDYLNRLTAISSTPSAAVAVSFNYNYNSANQRVQSALVDGSYWSYNYDSLGQVTSGKKYWADGTPVAGQQFDYAFDTIGNRNSTKSGGDEMGANQRTANYTNNTLNQITGRDVPGYVDIKGISIATNTLTVAGLTAYRKGEYFRKELTVGNSSAALWTNIVVAATGQASTTGNVFVAKAPEVFAYDLDGNLMSDGRWTNTWDAENRLANMTSLSSAPTGSKLKLDFAYDARGRRIQKIVSTNNGSAYYPQSTNKFMYDGWNLIAVLNPSSALVSSYVWGTDLSGSLQGAGGVGGLLEAVNYGVSTNFVAYDGNGNVAALIKASDGTVTANYEYGPFGEVVRATGLTAKANPFRFSGKYQDDESDLLYYGYRFYNQSQGRWLSRDPIEELGFINLGVASDCPKDKFNPFAFISNNPMLDYDYLGLTGDPMCGCSCGPDVTLAVYITFLNVNAVYSSRPKSLQHEACRNLRTPWGAADSWDIMSLRNWSWMDPRDPSYRACSRCDATVTYKGACAYANEVNYVLYGYASHLCGYGFPQSRVIMKRYLEIRGHDSSNEIEQKLSFVQDGYFFNTDNTVNMSYHRPSCLATSAHVKLTHPKRRGTFDPSDWIWEPLKSRQ